MLLEARLVHVPHALELEADRSEFGSISPKLCATYGEAAIDVGSPDAGTIEVDTSVTDALANIMHYCERESIDFDARLQSALTHYSAESS